MVGVVLGFRIMGVNIRGIDGLVGKLWLLKRVLGLDGG